MGAWHSKNKFLNYNKLTPQKIDVDLYRGSV